MQNSLSRWKKEKYVEEISFSPRDFVPCIYDCGKEPVSRADCADRRTRYSRMKSHDSAVRAAMVVEGVRNEGNDRDKWNKRKGKIVPAYTGKVTLSGNVSRYCDI